MRYPTLRLFDGFDHTNPGLRDEVIALQQRLNDFGAGLETDGLFGRGTESALLRFQAEHGLDTDGIAGPRTWAALQGEDPMDVRADLQTTRPRNAPSMLLQLEEAARYRDTILSGAESAGVPPALICGIGSRESHWGLLLQPPGPAGTGDFIPRRTARPWRNGELPPDGGGYGRGLMQIDYDAHPFARGDEWKDAQKNIHYGCKVLKQNIALLGRRTSLEGDPLLRAATAAYNCGAGNVLKAIERGLDVDYYTHSRDYARDTLDRAGWFRLHGWE